MENVTKVFFDPLLESREAVHAFVSSLPVGSAHTFKGSLLLKTKQGIETIDISKYDDDYFTNSISLADIGEDVLTRMGQFPLISKFSEEYSIQQAPSPTFQVPIEDGQIHIFAVSRQIPTFYDLCLADSNYKTSCYTAHNTFPGVSHSGDINAGKTLLHHIKLSLDMNEDPYTVFVSGYEYTNLWKYKAHNPVVLVANHSTKALYIVPVPLDTATIGGAVLCCPLVIKRDGNNLICSILNSPTTDDNLMCSGSRLESSSFRSAIERAILTLPDATISRSLDSLETNTSEPASGNSNLAQISQIGDYKDVLLTTYGATIPKVLSQKSTQVVRFGKGLQWVMGQESESSKSSTVLPCILGGTLEGPLLLATGEAPSNIPFRTMNDLHEYYKMVKSVVVVVDENMSDNARNLATSWRINGVFIVQRSEEIIANSSDVAAVLDKVNINAVTALAGPQSLIIVQLGAKYYFYRGMADVKYLNTSNLNFGQDVTDILTTFSVDKLWNPSWPRLVDLLQHNPVYLPMTNQTLKLDQLKETFRTSSLATLCASRDDIMAVVPQLQALLDQERLQELSAVLIGFVEQNIATELAPARKQYASFITQEFDGKSLESRKRKEKLMGDLRKSTKEVKDQVQWLTQILGNIVSTQTTSTRTHDLNRLIRQNTIKTNVNAAKALNFEKVTEMLEEHAGKMGVLIVNVETRPYMNCLRDAAQCVLNPLQLEVCALDSRTIYLEGLDAGLVLQQSQESHNGPLVSSLGREQPIMAMSTLDSRREQGSMLAWVCWDEFVALEDPYSVRWMEKCNEAHISALRIIMRSTLSEAVCSREVNLEPSSPATGQLMGALLMSTMLKLANTRNTLPATVSNPEDTTTLLMRGLFGNLLTIAGSGTKPLSFVWQLFGTLPQIDIPNTNSDWHWYEAVALLVPFTGWPLQKFKKNVIALLDKIIFRALTRNEQGNIKKLHSNSLLEYCEARNIQLLYSRTVITALKTMFTKQEGEELQASASRLLKLVPVNVKNQTTSYTRLYRYIVHLSKGGSVRTHDNLLAANVFTKRSAVFSQAKIMLSEAVRAKKQNKAISICKQILEERAKIENQWGLANDTVHIQCIKSIKEVLEVYEVGNEVPNTLAMKIHGDHEQKRVPWHVGKGESGTIEELDEGVLNEILGVSDMSEPAQVEAIVQGPPSKRLKQEDQLGGFKDMMKVSFLSGVQTANTFGDVCQILNVSEGAMKAFAALLVPGFQLESMPETFRALILSLLRDRNREAATVKPASKLFGVVTVDID